MAPNSNEAWYIKQNLLGQYHHIGMTKDGMTEWTRGWWGKSHKILVALKKVCIVIVIVMFFIFVVHLHHDRSHPRMIH